MTTQDSYQVQKLVNRMAFVALGAVMLFGCFAAFQSNVSVSAQFTKAQTIDHKVAPVSRTRVRLDSRVNTITGILPAAGQDQPASRRNGDSAPRNAAVPNDALEEEFLYQLNQYRASKGVGLVRPSILLSASAEKFSRELAESGAASSRFDGRNTKTRAQAAGYTVNTRFVSILYTTRSDPATMLDQMKVNRNDNAILLDPVWKIIGIGRNYSGHDGCWRWVLDFAAAFDKTTPQPDEYLIKLNLPISR